MSSRPLVFITGASSGIGQASCCYRRAGYRLALAARREVSRCLAQAQGCGPEDAGVYAADAARPRRDRVRRSYLHRGRASPMS